MVALLEESRRSLMSDLIHVPLHCSMLRDRIAKSDLVQFGEPEASLAAFALADLEATVAFIRERLPQSPA